MQTHLAADQRPAPMPILKMPENRDMATSVASGAEASTFTCMPRPIIMIATPQKMLSSIRCCGLCEAGSSSSRQASSRAIARLISRRVLVTEFTEQNAADNTGPAKD